MTIVKIVIKDLHKCTDKDLLFALNLCIDELIARTEEGVNHA